VHTDKGVTGIGEVDSCPQMVKAIIEAPPSHTQVHGLKELLMDQNPLETTVLWDRVWVYQGTLPYGRAGAVIQAMAGIDLYCTRLKFDGLRPKLRASETLATSWFPNTMAFSQKRKL